MFNLSKSLIFIFENITMFNTFPYTTRVTPEMSELTFSQKSIAPVTKINQKCNTYRNVLL